MIVAIWILALLLVGLWALAAWGLATLLATDGGWVAAVEPWLHRLPFGGWLEGVFPTWLETARALVDAAGAVLGWLGGAAPLLVWGLWGAASLIVVLLAALLTGIVVVVRRQAASAPPAAAA